MKIITFDSDAYKSLARKLDRIYEFVKEQAEAEQPEPAQEWLNNKQACELLEVSGRTLQRLRSAGEITYSIRGGKVRYKSSEVERCMSGRVIRSNAEREAELKDSHRQHHQKRKESK